MPAEDALEHLLQAAGEPDSPPVISALITHPDGRPAGRYPAHGRQEDLEATIAAAARRRLPIRSAGGGCVLVRRSAVESHGLPDLSLGRYAFTAWSARALAASPGWLIPAARATTAPVAGSPGDLLRALRASRRAGWDAETTLTALRDGLR
jgi:GT2 family glycosyltransferase